MNGILQRLPHPFNSASISKAYFSVTYSSEPGAHQAKDVRQRRVRWIVGLEADIRIGKWVHVPKRWRKSGAGQKRGTQKRRRAKQKRRKSNALEQIPPGKLRYFVATLGHGFQGAVVQARRPQDITPANRNRWPDPFSQAGAVARAI